MIRSSISNRRRHICRAKFDIANTYLSNNLFILNKSRDFLFVFRNEEEIVPQVLQAVLNLPENTHIALRYTSTQLVGELGEWIGKHPDTLGKAPNAFIWVITCIQIVFTAKQNLLKMFYLGILYVCYTLLVLVITFLSRRECVQVILFHCIIVSLHNSYFS